MGGGRWSSRSRKSSARAGEDRETAAEPAARMLQMSRVMVFLLVGNFLEDRPSAPREYLRLQQSRNVDANQPAARGSSRGAGAPCRSRAATQAPRRAMPSAISAGGWLEKLSRSVSLHGSSG